METENEYIFQVSKIDDTWKQYGLEEHYLSHQKQPVPFKAIVKDSNFITMVTGRYKLLPNELAVEIADESASLAGAVPFNKFEGNWFCRTNDHVFLTGKKKTQVHALFAFNEPYDIGEGDKIQLGFAVHNSIDGSLGLCVSAFTFRNACSNMVFMGMKGKGMSFDDRTVLEHIYQKHTTNLEVDRKALSELMLQVMKQGQTILVEYRRLKVEQLTIERARKLVDNLPEKYVPAYISVKDEKVELLTAKTMWETYNDITAQIWHNDKTKYGRKTELFMKLHEAIELKL